MTSFIEQTLLPNEQLVCHTRPHWIIFAPAIGWFVLWAVVMAAVWYFNVGHYSIANSATLSTILNFMGVCLVTVYGGMAYVQYLNSEYGVTNKRVLVKLGFISRYSREILLDKIESIQVFQSIPGRLFNYGSIIISGTGGTQDEFFNIPSPLEFRQTAQMQAENRDDQSR
ncbi:MAG: PH domain-containing protein, partial [Pseudomonadota bacterium]|nr:PH domain-containing protein [Pseudomonadota bacterium]